MIELNRIQEAIHEWSTRNFPNNTPEEPLLGMGEELGEIKHALLKIRQGIRGTPEELQAELVDAVGDFSIFMLDYSIRRGISIDEVLAGVIYLESTDDHQDDNAAQSLALVGSSLNQLELASAYGYDSQPYVASKLAQVWRALDLFSATQTISLDTTIDLTWQQVKQRDWQKNKATGVPVNAAS